MTLKPYIVVHDVLALSPEDAGIKQGIVRLHNSKIGKRGDVRRFYRWQPVVIQNPNTDRTIVRFVLGSPSHNPIKSENSIQLDYDAKLELEFDETHLLNVVPASSWNLYWWYWRHPDPGYRISARLGIISVGLGIISVIYALF